MRRSTPRRYRWTVDARIGLLRRFPPFAQMQERTAVWRAGLCVGLVSTYRILPSEGTASLSNGFDCLQYDPEPSLSCSCRCKNLSRVTAVRSKEEIATG